jgi:eukaryotic-like serine/threonine-protein kinase
MTRTGTVLGTPKYMSPEQVQGQPVDQRSDIYSLGLIFYEMLTGALPFSGDSTYQLMYQRVNQVPASPEKLNPQIPRYLSGIVLHCLERDPALRYQSAAEILADLRKNQITKPSVSLRVSHRLGSSRSKWILAGTLAVLLAAAVALGAHFWERRGERANAAVSRDAAASLNSATHESVLLLPLVKTQNEPELALQAEGLLESLSGRLSQLGSLKIETLPADNSFNQQASPQALAQQFGTQFYLTGSLENVGGKLHAQLKLQETSSGKTTWSEEFSALPQDVFAMQDEIYNKLLTALDVKPTNEELALGASRPTENVDAYDLYLRGRSAIRNQRSVATLNSAIQLYNEALKRDPGFGLAYAGLADAYLDLYRFTKDPALPQKALGAALQADQLSGSKPEVHFSLGSVYMATGKNTEAVAEFKRALELAPNSDEGYRRLGSAWLAAGHKDDALAAYQQSVRLNPYYWLNYAMLGKAGLAFGENEKAIAAYQRVIELVPNRADGYNGLGIAYFQQGKFEQCVPQFQKALSIEPAAEVYSDLGTAYFYLKRYSDAIQAYQEAAKLDPQSQIIAGNLADAYRAAGQADAASKAYDHAISLAYKDYQVNPRDAGTLASLSIYYAKKGDSAHSLEFIHRARTLQPDSLEYLADEAIVNALANRPKQAMEAVRMALAKGYPADELKNEPELESLQSLPEFQQLVAKASSSKK